MIRKVKNYTFLLIMFVICVGCVPKATTVEKSEQNNTKEKSSEIFNYEPADKQLFEEALSHLSNGQKEPNYMETKIRLDEFIKKYPESKWVDSAQSLIFCLNRISDLEIKLGKEKQKAHGESIRQAREMESLKQNARSLEEKCSAETTKLQQENEQLKKDIQRLKNLEIQLEKREKMLR